MSFSVVAIFEAKAGKDHELLKILNKAVDQCKNEESNIESRLHKSIEKASQFFLYENWASKGRYLDMLEKPNIKSLVKEISPLLEKSPRVCFGEEI